MQSSFFDYHDNDTLLKGFYAYDDKYKNTPIILIAHDWSGNNHFAQKKAQQLAQLGYLGFAIDMYGAGKIGTTKEEKTALITPLIQDRKKLQQRIFAALTAVKNLNKGDQNNIAAIGFCFGGLCVLDLARMGADIKGVVSFHGLLNPPAHEQNNPIKAHILVLHGFDDPMVRPEAVISFGKEMTDRKADWQMHLYGNTMHAFANPEANDPAFGTVYSSLADQRSWLAMKNFFEEIFPVQE